MAHDEYNSLVYGTIDSMIVVQYRYMELKISVATNHRKTFIIDDKTTQQH